jgi:hypothetical protein
LVLHLQNTFSSRSHNLVPTFVGGWGDACVMSVGLAKHAEVLDLSQLQLCIPSLKVDCR